MATITDNILIDNLKCGGCEATIKNTLKKMQGVQKVNINRDESTVSIMHDELVSRVDLKRALKTIGYPESGTIEGLDKVLTNAKSYISCAVGRMSEPETTEAEK